MSFIGQSLVLASLFFAAAGAVLGFWGGAKRSLKAWDMARQAAYGFSGTMILANLAMVYALITHDFSVKYVAEVGSLATPPYITVISLWASLNGSILFWGGVLGVYVLGFIWIHGSRHREYMPYTLGMILSVSLFFALLVASVADPFAPMNPVPLDGPGPNPLLANHWLMGVHPPTLYLGYVGMVVPFSMICAALLAGRLDNGWMQPLRTWMIIPWSFLTVGIVLGGWWSYGVLGWGGYWAWDPVENASFHPWLTGTAFIHSAMVYQRRGGLRIWTLVLGMATFLLTLVGTFMTRSGVFNSVHSFTQSAIGPVFLVFIGVVLVFSVLLLALREHTLADDEETSDRTSMMTALLGQRYDVLSREFAILLQNAVFATFTFTVLLGTLYPLIAEAMLDKQVSVREPYFDQWALPLGILLVFLMGVGPALPWGRMSPQRAMKRFGQPALAGVVFAGLVALGGFTGIWTLVTAFLCGFAFVANFGEFWTPVQVLRKKRGNSLGEASAKVYTRARRRIGGHIAHYGVLLAAITIALSKGYKEERDFTLNQGESAEFAGWTVTYHDAKLIDEGFRNSVTVNLTAAHEGGRSIELHPKMNYYPTQREPIFTPDMYTGPVRDLYASVIELPPQGEYVVVRLMDMPYVSWLWLAPFIIVFGTAVAAWPARKKKSSSAAREAVA